MTPEFLVSLECRRASAIPTRDRVPVSIQSQRLLWCLKQILATSFVLLAPTKPEYRQKADRGREKLQNDVHNYDFQCIRTGFTTVNFHYCVDVLIAENAVGFSGHKASRLSVCVLTCVTSLYRDGSPFIFSSFRCSLILVLRTPISASSLGCSNDTKKALGEPDECPEPSTQARALKLCFSPFFLAVRGATDIKGGTQETRQGMPRGRQGGCVHPVSYRHNTDSPCGLQLSRHFQPRWLWQSAIGPSQLPIGQISK
ncbi:hypothetical protein KQX54_007700 [Cotesia glomerata]|uniref:Uncharacterized protein n=1 Tax=Cotesia glomerata TaxID=32391 RepID=A0AAV7I1P1_COTGL|nr:hypothetical protein KQX54_007700 [Cotesia glomerata]